jgi:hypothetical protein
MVYFVKILDFEIVGIAPEVVIEMDHLQNTTFWTVATCNNGKIVCLQVMK